MASYRSTRQISLEELHRQTHHLLIREGKMEKVCNSCITHTDITKLKVTTARVENFSYAWLRTFFWFVLVFKTWSLDQCEQEELQFKQVFFQRETHNIYLQPWEETHERPCVDMHTTLDGDNYFTVETEVEQLSFQRPQVELEVHFWKWVSTPRDKLNFEGCQPLPQTRETNSDAYKPNTGLLAFLLPLTVLHSSHCKPPLKPQTPNQSRLILNRNLGKSHTHILGISKPLIRQGP